MIKAILFDLDGTLIDSLDDLCDCANAALKKCGYAQREREEYKYFVGNGIPKMLSRASSETDAGKIDILKAHFMELYSVHYADKTCAYDGMPELIAALKNKDLKIAVITNKMQEMADVVVKKLYGDAFDIIFGKRDGVPAKPDPTAVFTVMSQLEVNPDECVFLGDSGVDILTAVNSGALPVGELWGYRKEDELLQNGARFIINSPSEFLKLIEELNG